MSLRWETTTWETTTHLLQLGHACPKSCAVRQRLPPLLLGPVLLLRQLTQLASQRRTARVAIPLYGCQLLRKRELLLFCWRATLPLG
jgi:hypothetical protein